jgi:hypothetical protein
MTTKRETQPGATGKPEVNHKVIAWALAGVLNAGAVWRFSQAIVDAANRLGSAIGAAETFDLRAEAMILNLLDAHAGCAYDLDGQDKGKGKRAYARLLALAGGAEGSPEPEDKTSCAWVCWTMRRIRAGFYCDPDGPDGSKPYYAAWREVETLLFPLWHNSPGDKSTADVLTILGTLVLRKRFYAELAASKKGGA